MCFQTSLFMSVLQHIATGSTLQHTALHCNTLQHTATHCNTLQHTASHCNTLQHNATHYNKRHHTATHCNVLQHTARPGHAPKSNTKRGFFQKETQQCRQTTNDSYPIRHPQARHASLHILCATLPLFARIVD